MTLLETFAQGTKHRGSPTLTLSKRSEEHAEGTAVCCGSLWRTFSGGVTAHWLPKRLSVAACLFVCYHSVYGITTLTPARVASRQLWHFLQLFFVGLDLLSFSLVLWRGHASLTTRLRQFEGSRCCCWYECLYASLQWYVVLVCHPSVGFQDTLKAGMSVSKK